MSEDSKEFESISPYTDEEAIEALGKVADHRLVPAISKYLFPDEDPDFLKNALKSIRSIDEFQLIVMSKAIRWAIDTTIHNFSYNGVSNLTGLDTKFLMMSNHRDIILDPALTQYVLYQNGLALSQIAVGSNLLSSKTVEYLLRSNRMIKVIRGISARELYLFSGMLSKYIRKTIVGGESSIWLAQRQGRTKNGVDTTEQGLLKMLDMSGSKSFTENFMELHIVPLSISYEYEPCDILKAREILISRTQKYVKGENEDLHSILVGITQKKGNVHLNIGEPLREEEVEEASFCDNKNDRYQAIRHAVDKRVIEGYKLWNTNYMGYDLANRSYKYADRYTPEELEAFTEYTEHQLDQAEPTLNREDLRDIFLRIYGNPVATKEGLKKEGLK